MNASDELSEIDRVVLHVAHVAKTFKDLGRGEQAQQATIIAVFLQETSKRMPEATFTRERIVAVLAEMERKATSMMPAMARAVAAVRVAVENGCHMAGGSDRPHVEVVADIIRGQREVPR